MKSGWSGDWNRYTIAVICAVLGLVLRVPVSAVLGTDVPYITFFPAIVLSTWYGGIAPGIVTTLLSGALAHGFVDGTFPPIAATWIRIVLFLAMAGMMVWVIAELRAAQSASRSRRPSNFVYSGDCSGWLYRPGRELALHLHQRRRREDAGS